MAGPQAPSPNPSPSGGAEGRKALIEALHHLEHVLPGQAPLRDFVHHNTLHGFQHLPFREAVVEAARRIGARGFLPPEEFRRHFRRGRIERADLEAALLGESRLDAAQPLATFRDLHKRDVYLAALLHPIEPVTRAQLDFQAHELRAFERFQEGVGAEARARISTLSQGGAQALIELWAACLDALGVEHTELHPEDAAEPESAPDATAWPELNLANLAGEVQDEAEALLARLLARVGRQWTLRDLMRALTGEDLMANLRPALLRHLAAHLDLGLAAWHNPERARGFYAAWRASVGEDLGWGLIDLPEWRQIFERLPEDALDAIAQELDLLGLARDRWADYLEGLALELPGWSGMFLWRERHPGYGGAGDVPVRLADYLAVRLALERLFAHGMCRRRWRVEPTLSTLRWYFRRHPAELLVRHALYSEELPEHLVSAARELTQQATFALEQLEDADWEDVAERIAAWHRRSAAGQTPEHTVRASAWPLFLLCQHLGICGRSLREAGPDGARELLDCLRHFDRDSAGYVWLRAYERHYRERIFAALLANHGRGPWAERDAAPEAQLVFCMDDREEGMRRHLEEANPALETLGAAAHFNVPHNWRGLDDLQPAAQAPVVPTPVIPAHEAREVAREQAAGDLHARRHGHLRRWRERLHQDSRRGALLPVLLTSAAAPFALAGLAGRLLAPARAGRLAGHLREGFEKRVATRVDFVAANDSPPASPQAPRLGFTDAEQAERVQALLRSTGLTRGFAPLVAIVGHASRNQNNPHASAYNCGACAGRFSGPNARLVAAMANRPQVRALLAGAGITIPDGTWFAGAEHDTCSDGFAWYDIEDVPANLRPALDKLRAELDRAAHAHAQERCRRFASAPPAIPVQAAHRHAAGRAADFSQARPELGHATNACAFFGRRAMSRGAFFDRRAFLISYDPAQDPEGSVLERHLLTNGAVGAGISLEYYFSTVNNEQYGCGTKVVHNVAGLLGVMEGASSDLRTGLPLQMIEIHEAMRLLVVVEQRTEVLDAIYARQPALQDLVGNGWVQLAAKHPELPRIDLFEPGRGWVRWEGAVGEPPLLERSADWYLGHDEALAPALLVRPVARGPRAAP